MVRYKKYSDIEVFEGKITNHQYPWHFHHCYTIIIVESGSIIYEFKDKSIKVDEFEVLIIEPFVVHRNIISQLTKYKAIFLPNDYFETERQNKIMTRIVNHPFIADIMVGLLNKIELNYSKNELKDYIFELCEYTDEPPLKNRALSCMDTYKIPKTD